MELQSPEINELVKALVAAKKEFKPLRADVKGNYGEYSSSDAIKDATEVALGNHGLYFAQNRAFIDGKIFLQSRLLHTSGQWLSAYFPLSIPENVRSIDQAYGSATTYQRRYEAYGMLGLGKGDGIDPDNEQEEPQTPPSIPGLASEAQIKYLSNLLNGKEEAKRKLLDIGKVDSLDKLSSAIASQAIKQLSKKV